MDVSQLPIHERLDALINRLDSDSDTENAEYQQFVGRQAANGVELDAEPADAFPKSDAFSDAFSEPEEAESPKSPAKSPARSSPADSPSRSPLGSPTGSPTGSPIKSPTDIIRSVYEEAGVEAPGRRLTEKQVEREREEAARNDLRLERELAPEVGARVVKTFPVSDFLAELDASESEHEPEPEPVPVSSPPAPPLTQFVGSADGDGLRADDELEIVPETKTGKMSRPVRDMLKFAGAGSASDKKLASERGKLRALEREQNRARQHKHKQLLQAQGLDPDAINEEITAQQRQKAGGAEAWLANERENAEKLRDAEMSESDEDDAPVVRRKILNDEDSDTDSDSDREVVRAGKFDNEGTQYVPAVSSTALADIMGLDEDTAPDTATDTVPDTVPDTVRDTVPDTVPDDEEELEIVRKDTVPRETITPDLSGLNKLPAEKRLEMVRQRYLEAKAEKRRKELKQTQFVEDQAEESEDENEPHSGDEEEEDVDRDLEELVERGKVDVRASELKRRFLEEEKIRDQKLLNKFVDGVHGGFRRRQQGGRGDQFLVDDDLEFSDDETNHRLLIESRRKSSLLKSNEQVAQLAANQGAAAFFTSISEDLVSRPQGKRASIQESLDFLHSFDAERKETVADFDYEGPSYTSRKVSVSRPKSILERSQQIVKSGRGGTYASRIASADAAPRRVEITATLGRPKQASRPKLPRVAATARGSGSGTGSGTGSGAAAPPAPKRRLLKHKPTW